MPTQHFVPPGHGKSQTRSRNLRRRLKKKCDKATLAQSADPASTAPKNCSATNMISLGPKPKPTEADTTPDITAPNDRSRTDTQGDAPGRDPETEQPAEGPQGITTMNVDGGRIMMSTLRNKNKRKGFKQSMSAPLPLKIVFDEENASKEPDSQQPAQDVPAPEVIPTRPRLIPPSERQERGELPPRMFVTSVDVEEGMWSSSQRKKRRKQKQSQREEQAQEDYDYQGMPMQEENVQLDYSGEAAGDTPDWDRAEKGWDEFVAITDIGQLAVGTLVGWKALALNPLTFSPEVMLSLASVVRLSDAEIVIKQFSRPGASSASFSHRFAVPEQGEEEIVEEEEYTWNDILTLQWKIVKL
ncbi:hypothetical protein C0993_008167 [Termitomyces sp. T159_Od127]|nr:hypothetical protein C0993_008167 [Termitomyces sp. T159_Od127]